MTYRSILLSSAALLSPFLPALAQRSQRLPRRQPAAPRRRHATRRAGCRRRASRSTTIGDEEEIVVTGARARGSVVGDIPPENTLDARDVRATGATSITELLDALAPQIGSSRGRGGEAPVLLLNGQRISGFRELRDIPTEAIQRVEILPEEVALKYGYRADQKVVNIVLRQRFRSTTAQVGAGVATDGGYANGNADLTRFLVQRNGRTTLNLHADGNSLLTEAERNILLDPSQPPAATTEQALAARSLVGRNRDVRGSATVNRTVFGNVSATLNTELEHSDGRSLIGLNPSLLEPLARNDRAPTARMLGGVLNGTTKSQWRWTVTSNADLDGTSPAATATISSFPTDRARQTTASGDLKAHRQRQAVQASRRRCQHDADARRQHRASRQQPQPRSVRRVELAVAHEGEAAINLDLPISRRNRDFSALGNLTLNANAEVDQLSDFGTLTTIGAGANWSPVDRLNFIASWTREEGPPTINQLGDPVLDTPGSRIFDFTTGQTVLVDAITGGNPEPPVRPRARGQARHQLAAVRQDRPSPARRLRPSDDRPADFEHQRHAGDRGGVPRALRPRRRRAAGQRRPAAGQFRQRAPRHAPRRLRFLQAAEVAAAVAGGDRPDPRRNSASAAAARRCARRARRRPARAPAKAHRRRPAPPPEARGGGGGFGGGGGGGGGGGFFGGGGGSRGRLQFSLTDTITFVDKVRITPGGPELDYLHGDAAGSTGGTPAPQGRGAGRLVEQRPRRAARRQLAQRHDGHDADRRRPSFLAARRRSTSACSPIPATFPRSRSSIRGCAARSSGWRSTTSSTAARRSAMRRAIVPLNYQPGLLDPLGRTIMISFRKLFLPSPATFRRLFQQERPQGAPTR